jgi:DNA-directed RNA polymerase subunit RPC12/RpoP
MYNIGEKPGKGTYCCTKCGEDVKLDDDDDRLTPCPKCGGGPYTRC